MTVIAQNSTIRSLFLEGPAGRLEALLNAGAENATHAAVVCHPHPLFGGTLHNKVVFHTMKALNSFGFPVLRFNFRGAGLSHGEHDHGNGEVDDVRDRSRLAGCGVSSAAGVCRILFRRGGWIAGGVSGCAGEGVIGVGTSRRFRSPPTREVPRSLQVRFPARLHQAQVVCQRWRAISLVRGRKLEALFASVRRSRRSLW